MTAHHSPTEALLQTYGTDPNAGLTQEQAEQAKARYGANKLAEQKKKTNLQRFFAQFKDVMIIILLIAAAVSFGIACTTGETSEFFEPVLILLIVVLNAVMGMLQESKAEKALDALKNLSAPHARVLRDGKEQVIDASELVPGDIIHLEAGDFVPADARLLESVSLKSEESALTGESVPSEKDAQAQVAEDAPLGDRSNMVFSGCSITYGTATALVTGTGMNTEMGKIAGLLSGEQESQTPLQKKLAQLGKYLGILALAACAIIFVVGLLDGMDVLDIFMTSVSLAVSAIPEGLPAIVTIVLSIGVQRMVKKNAIIRRLPAVETLGGASVICSDKTGTLTQNRMTLVKAYVDGESFLEDIGTSNSPKVKRLLMCGTLCSDGSVTFDHVAFGYGEEPVIKDFSATVKAGQKVAIVGPTGAGKTTMVKLLMRFYDVDSGQITLDGHPITEFSRQDLRSQFGMVLQDAWLYSGTILENIRYGKLTATDEEVMEAARLAQADHFIHTLPGGYHMELNEESTNVSQGQKQLLTIARAILSDAKVMILDEATSSVDTRTEVLIQKAMDNLMKGRTSFIIAHRLSTIRDADMILVMRDGDIVEQGNHEELLQKGGFYASLYNSQFEHVG